MDKFVDIGLYASYALVVICTVLAVLMPLFNAFGNPQSLIKPVAGLLLLVVVDLWSVFSFPMRHSAICSAVCSKNMSVFICNKQNIV